MNDGDLLAVMGTDAEAWAREMAKRIPGLDPTPGELLHTWLANAIEAGRSAGYAAAREGR